MSKPLVSVIIPAFNSARYVREAIGSVSKQTYSPIEVIVVDDGSTDDIRQLLATLIDSQAIRYHYQANQGLAAARNAGIKLARGKYLQFLDADDLLYPDKIQKQVEQLESATAPGLSGCDFRYFFNADTSHLYGGDSFKGKFPLRSADRLFQFETIIHRWLFPASLVRELSGFEEDIPTREDWLLLWKLAVNGTRFSYVDEPLVLYRRHRKNMTCDDERMAVDHLHTIDQVEKHQHESALSLYSQQELNVLRESYHRKLGFHYVRINRSALAWHQLRKAMALSPNHRQIKLLLMLVMRPLGRRTIGQVGSTNNRVRRWARSIDQVLSNG